MAKKTEMNDLAATDEETTDYGTHPHKNFKNIKFS